MTDSSPPPEPGPEPAPPPEYLPAPPPEPPRPSNRRRRLVVLLAVLGALVLVGAALAVPVAVERWRDLTTPTLDDVRIYEDLRSDHINDDEKVEYDPAPPPGGPHADIWLECGVYDEPVRDENAVHSLEHGTVWITYDPEELSADDVSELAEQLPGKGILSPYPGQDARVIVTVWGRQLDLRSPGDDRLGLFLEAYGDGHTAPEPMASCEGGQRITDKGDETGMSV